MAHWQRVPDAKGYQLDVSTHRSFSTFLPGFHGLDVGERTSRLVTGLRRRTTYYYRVRPYDSRSRYAASAVMSASTASTSGLTILAPVDPTIASKPYASNIEGAITRAINIYESLYCDPVTIRILFRYSTTAPDGSALPADIIARSDWVYYKVPWNTYINALANNAVTDYDITAKTSFPSGPWSSYIAVSSANGRAVGLDTPGAPFPGGAFGNVPYDGIVTVNSAAPFQFYRPTYNGNFDAQRMLEHEIDEVLGLGSRLNLGGANFRPQDLFSWSSPGVRNLTTNGTRYFSIDRGTTRIVSFNQNSRGDLGDWLSTACPQANPYVQNAFSCPNQYSDVTVSSPEVINLDVIGYDLNAPAPGPTDFNHDKYPDYVLYNPSTRQTVIWYLKNNVLLGGSIGPTPAGGWRLVGVADFNRDGHPDYLLFSPVTRQTVIAYLSGVSLIGSASGPTIPAGWEAAATGDFNKDSKPDLVLYNTSTQQIVVWYLNNNVLVGGGPGFGGLPLSPDYVLVGVADFNRDGYPDFLSFDASTGQTEILVSNYGGRNHGPTVPNGYQLVGTADFNGDGKPDYLLYNPTTRQTVIWYLSRFFFYIGAASGPALPGGWTVAAP